MEGALTVTPGSLGPSLPHPCACRLALDPGKEAVRQELERWGSPRSHPARSYVTLDAEPPSLSPTLACVFPWVVVASLFLSWLKVSRPGLRPLCRLGPAWGPSRDDPSL